ncbi:MAG: hypothetical protein ACO3YZ_05230, partial [Candidatus Nanopelagicaceae bacterium]
GGGDQNPRYQNGVAHFVQESPPAWRDEENLVPLVEGDRWYKPIDNGVSGTAGLWLYTGAYWVTETVFNYETGSNPTIATVNNAIKTGGSLLLLQSDLRGIPWGFNTLKWMDTANFWFSGITSSNFDSSNSFDLYPALAQSDSADAYAVTVDADDIILTIGAYRESNFPLKSVVNIAHVTNLFRVTCYVRNVVGVPAFTGGGNIGFGMNIAVRGVHP